MASSVVTPPRILTLPAPQLGTLSGAIVQLMDATSESLGGSLQIQYRSGEAAFSQARGFPCTGCTLDAPATECVPCGGARCRGAKARRDPQPEQWICPHGCEVTRVPILAPGMPLRWLVCVRPPSLSSDAPAFDGASMRMLVPLASVLAEQFRAEQDRRDLDRRLTRTQSELNLLYAVSGKLTEEEDMRKAVRDLLEQARVAVGAEAALAFVGTRRFFETAKAVRPNNGVPSTRALRDLGARIARQLETSGRRFFVGSEADWGDLPPALAFPARLVAVEVLTGRHAEGVLCFIHREGALRHDRSDEIRLLETLGEQVGRAVSNHDLYDDLQDFLMSTVKSLVSAIEAKDPYTSGHSERVHLLSMLIGRTIGLPPDEMENLKWASILHDVGKIGMPERILKKPGILTPEEYEIMKEHPERGYKVLAPITQLSQASMGVRCHHEMVNGRGYPIGLRGDEIPRIARVISVADTYDALTTTRAYRARRSPDEAFAVIADVRGSQLDTCMVDALESLMPFIREHEVMIQSGIMIQAGLDMGGGDATEAIAA